MRYIFLDNTRLEPDLRLWSGVLLAILSLSSSSGTAATTEISGQSESVVSLSSMHETDRVTKIYWDNELRVLRSQLEDYVSRLNDLQEAIQQERQMLKDDTEKLHAQVKSVAKRAVRLNKNTADTAALVVSMMAWFLGALAVLLAIATGYGIYEARHLRRIRDQAEAALKKASNVQQKAEEAGNIAQQQATIAEGHVSFIVGVKDSTKQSLENISSMLDKLRPQSPIGIAHVKIDAPDPVFAIDLRDSDIAIVLSDTLGLMPEAAEAADFFYKVARHWMSIDKFPEACQRITRAIELDPSKPIYYILSGRILSQWAIGSSTPSVLRESRLKQALESLDKAAEISGKRDAEILHEYGWIYDEIGDFDEALNCYQEAIELDRCTALLEKRTPKLHLNYNLMVTLVKVGRLAEAVDILRGIADKKLDWRPVCDIVKLDPEMEPLLNSLQWRPVVEQICSS
ncbi:MAG: tetratricopeptide repeat protein [Nitrososphaera sp.]|nr:tetratricopeptide repeat protein [Nitrososphaera sp.]